MVALVKPEVIFTHESDLDGFVSGLLLQRLAQKVFQAEVPLEAHHYHSWRMREPREKTAWVCDFTFESRLDRPDWLVIDHHTTDCHPRHARVIHDLQKSSGLLCYELCREHGIESPALERLVHLNNISDLFLEQDPEFLLAGDYASLVKNYQFWNLHALVDGKLEALLDHPLLEVMAVKRTIEDPLGLAWSRTNIEEIAPNVGHVETIIGNTNAIVHQLLAQEISSFAVLLTLFRRNNGAFIVSLRSRNGEALKVAEKLQGGGHANASGATLPRSIKSQVDALNYLRQVLNPGKERRDQLNSLQDLFSNVELKNG